MDNRYNPKIAQKNADVLVREKVDIAIEYQTDRDVAAIVAAKYRAANIPLIAVEIPHPGATFYGANNYEAGLIGGRYLGRWAKQHWDSRVDEILLMELARAGESPQDALDGTPGRIEGNPAAGGRLSGDISGRRRAIRPKF